MIGQINKTQGERDSEKSFYDATRNGDASNYIIRLEDFGFREIDGIPTYTFPGVEPFSDFDFRPSPLAMGYISEVLENKAEPLGKYVIQQDADREYAGREERLDVSPSYLSTHKTPAPPERLDGRNNIDGSPRSIYLLMDGVASNGHQTEPLIPFDEELIGRNYFNNKQSLQPILDEIKKTVDAHAFLFRMRQRERTDFWHIIGKGQYQGNAGWQPISAVKDKVMGFLFPKKYESSLRASALIGLSEKQAFRTKIDLIASLPRR